MVSLWDGLLGRHGAPTGVRCLDADQIEPKARAANSVRAIGGDDMHAMLLDHARAALRRAIAAGKSKAPSSIYSVLRSLYAPPTRVHLDGVRCISCSAAVIAKRVFLARKIITATCTGWEKRAVNLGAPCMPT